MQYTTNSITTSKSYGNTTIEKQVTSLFASSQTNHIYSQKHDFISRQCYESKVITSDRLIKMLQNTLFSSLAASDSCRLSSGLSITPTQEKDQSS